MRVESETTVKSGGGAPMTLHTMPLKCLACASFSSASRTSFSLDPGGSGFLNMPTSWEAPNRCTSVPLNESLIKCLKRRSKIYKELTHLL